MLLMISRNVTGQSELVGVPQPFSIFVDRLIPLPGGGKYGKLMFFIDILMWLKDEDQLAVVSHIWKKCPTPQSKMHCEKSVIQCKRVLHLVLLLSSEWNAMERK